MPNFNFKSQFPIADVIAAAQKKPLMEAQIAQANEQTRQERFKQLLDALSTGAQVSRLASQNKTDALARQGAQSQMQGQQDLQGILAEPPPQAPVAAPIQQFGRSGPIGPDGQTGPVVPTNTVQPTFNQTPEGISQPQRLQAALLKGFPEAAGTAFANRQFADPLDRQMKQAQIQNVGVDNQINAAKFMEEKRKNAAGEVVDQQKLDIERQKLAVEREKLKADALANGTKLSDPQAAGLLFGERAAQAHKQLEDLMAPKIDPQTGATTPGFDPTSKKAGAQAYLPNMMQPENVQLLQQAKLNFISAVLRKESGAAISTSEIKNAEKQYFPVAGDKATVLAQKKANRETAIQGLFRAGGPQGEQLLQKYRLGAGSDSGPSAGAKSAPAPGSVENGYVFKGGNPGDPNNWAKQ